jgi:hypothetical protein
LSSIFNLVIRYIFKINKRLTIYCIVFYGILKGTTNRKTTTYKCIACKGVIVAGIVEADAFILVVADIIACNGVVAGRGEADAFIVVVADIIACNGVIVAGRIEVDAVPVVADIIACNCIVAGIGEADAFIVVADIVACNNVIVESSIPTLVLDKFRSSTVTLLQFRSITCPASSIL